MLKCVKIRGRDIGKQILIELVSAESEFIFTKLL